MPVTAQLQLDDRERAQLARILGCEVGQLERRLAPYATAALEEYVRMFLGERVFSRGIDLREYRLFLLVRHVFGDRLPAENRISALFQTTPSQSRSMLRSVLAKFQYVLDEQLRATLAETIGRARRRKDAHVWTVGVASPSVVDELDRTIATLDGSLPLLRRDPATASTYELQRSAYLRLCEHFGLEPKDVE